MKKLSLILLLASLLCLGVCFTACDTEAPNPCANGHITVTDAAKAPTCTEKGLTEGTHCTVCHAVIKAQTELPATGHTEGEWITQLEPTCTAQGSRYRTCTTCEVIVSVESVDALDHSFGAWTESLQPTCTRQGEEHSTCERCGVTQSRATNAVAHKLTAWQTDLAPTCTQQGTRHRSCTVCKNIITVEALPATGHDMGSFAQTQPASCTNDGVESAACHACGHVQTKPIKATGHTSATDWTVDITASCTAEGSKHKSCTACGAVTETDTIPKLSHLFSAWRVTTPASCYAEGEQTRICSRCATTQKNALPLVAHTPSDWTVTLNATCAAKGAQHKSCTVCGLFVEFAEIPALAHTYGTYTVTKSPTCLSEGEESAECARCHTLDIKPLSALSHEAGEWVTDVLPSCEAAGSKHQSCTRCKEILHTESIPQKQHAWDTELTVREASCTAAGLKSYTCSSCQATKTESTAALAHTPTDWVLDLSPTCTTAGKRHKSCQVCEAVLTLETIAVTEHAYGTPTQTPSTCTTQGMIVSTCSTCGNEKKESLDLAAHTQSEWITDVAASCEEPGSKHLECTVCRQVLDTATTPKRNHAWSTSFVLTTAPSCTSPGIETKSCANCSAKQTRSVEPLAHVAGAWVTNVSASCLGAGSRYQACKTCTLVLTIEQIPATGHTFGEWSVTRESTCSKQGEKEHVCSACGMGEKELLPLAAHTPDAWITVLSPTCFAEGVKQRNCKNCDAIAVLETIPKRAHTTSDTWEILTMPTATLAGESALCCTVCRAPVETVTNTLDGVVVVPDKTFLQSVLGYALVFPAGKNTSVYFNAQVNALADALKDATTLTFAPRSDATTTKKEILVGLTARAESKKAYASLQGRGFTIRADGDKIVIVGSDDTLTMAGVQYFIRTYLNGVSSTTLTMYEDASACHLSALPLAGGAGSSFVYVMDADLDNDPLHMYVGGTGGDGRDYPSFLFEDLLSNISTRSGAALADLIWITDANKAYAEGYELLFGEIDRPESRAFRDELDGNEYGFCITGTKVIVTAHTDAGLELAKNAFLAFYEYVIACNGGILPQGYREVGTVSSENWMMDFPRPDNATICQAQHANNHSLQMIYTGTGATASGFLSYCQKLESAGYVLVTKNDNPGNMGSYFRVYKNESKNHALYVAYNAFSAKEDYAASYATEESKGTQYGDFIHYSKPNTYNVYYPLHNYEQCIRVVTAPLSSAYLPTDEVLQDTYDRATDKICESSITAVRYIGSSVGMGYILQLEDGRFVIIDGGANVAANKDKEVLYATLRELHKKVYGSYPTASNPIHIAAWLITHSHGDHYGNANAFLKTYVPTGLIKMDYLIGNFPEMSTIYPVGSDSTWMGQNVSTLRGYFTTAKLTPFTFIKVYTGMTLYFANLKMEILMTYGDHAPYRITNSNDTNTVTKWTIRSQNKDTTWTVLGDSCIYQSRWLCAMWGGSYNASTGLYDNSYLHTDLMQLAHHGNIGCEIALYKTIQPTVVFFPHHAGTYNSYTQDDGQNWADVVDRYVIKTLPSVKYIVVSGISGTSYTDSVTISFNANGIYLPDSGNPAWGIMYDKTSGAVTTVNIAYNTKKPDEYKWGIILTQKYDITYVNTSPIIKK